mgnify:FL=1
MFKKPIRVWIKSVKAEKSSNLKSTIHAGLTKDMLDDIGGRFDLLLNSGTGFKSIHLGEDFTYENQKVSLVANGESVEISQLCKIDNCSIQVQSNESVWFCFNLSYPWIESELAFFASHLDYDEPIEMRIIDSQLELGGL